MLKGPDFIIEYINQYNLDIWQRRLEDVLGKPLFEARPDIRAGAEAIHQHVYQTEKRFKATEIPIELCIAGKRETRFFDAIIDPLRDESGIVIGQLCTSIEVTEKVLSRKVVEEHKAKLEMALDAGDLGTFEYYPLSGVLVWSDRTKALFGLSKEASIDYSRAIGAVHPNDREYIEKEIQKAHHPEFGGLYELEYRVIGIEDGVERWVCSRGKISYDESGMPFRFAGVIQDITSKKKVEQDLKLAQSESEKQRRLYEALTSSTPDLIYVFDLKYRFTYANPALLAMWGRDWESATGKRLRELGYEDWHAAMHEREIDTVVAQKAPVRGTVSFAHAVLGERVYDYLLSPIFNCQGEVEAVAGITRDVSEAKLAEINIRNSEARYRSLADQLENTVQERTRALSRSNEDLQQFAHVASHDLKEPVRKVLTFSNLLQVKLQPYLNEQTTSYFEKIEKSALRMYSMIDGVLLYSSLDVADKHHQLINLAALMREITFDLELLIAEKQAHLEFGDLPILPGAPALIYQLFYNLIKNSLKFSQANIPPFITLHSKPAPAQLVARCGLSNEHSYYQFELEDNGIGFDPSFAEQIFGTFIRLHSKDHYEGCGLGLAVCKKIVERHGGFIWAEGMDGNGAKFIFLLPNPSIDVP